MRKSLKASAALLLAAALLPLWCFAALADQAAAPSPVIEKKTFPYLYCYTSGHESEGEMDLYFVGGDTVPYVALSDAVPLIAGMYNAQYERGEDSLISFDIQAYPQEGSDPFFIVTRPDNSSALIIDPAADTMTFTNYNSFDQNPGSTPLVRLLDIPDPAQTNDLSAMMEIAMQAFRKGETGSDLMAMLNQPQEDPAAGHGLFVATNRIFNRRGKPLEMRLCDYRIDILSQNGECYLPLQTVSDVFFSLKYLNFVFNGETVICDMYKGKLFDKAYEAEPQDMDLGFATFNFHELCFFMDYFYGLKQEHRFTSFTDFVAADAAKFPQITGLDPIAFDSALTEILMRYFDDSHSALVRYSWRSGQPGGAELIGMVANLGYSTQAMQAAALRLETARKTAYPDGVPGYEEIGDTAFVTFDSFTVNRDRLEDYYEIEDPDDPQDTIELIMYANRMVRREGSPVKNIVLDISLNGGGNSSAAIAVACWFTGEAKFALLDTMTGAETIACYRTDLNTNGITLSDPNGSGKAYDTGDTVAGQYNLFCLISPHSFSCGNLVPALFDNVGGITLIGQKSGGGSNAVLPASTASGFLYQMSGPLQITTFHNGSLYGVDQGVEPHVRLNFCESFFDREGLVEMIHGMK